MSSFLAGPTAPQPGVDRAGLAIDPRLAIVAAVAFAVAVVALDGAGPLLAANVLALLLAHRARLPLAPTLRRVAVVDSFILVTLATLPFTVPGTPALTIGPLVASVEGLWQAASIGLKTNAVVVAVLALVGTLEPATVGHALAALRLPAALVHVLLFTVRYVEVLGDEYRRLRTAMTARGFRPRNARHTWRSYGYLMGMMFVRSVERSERVLAAMKCRGYTGRLPRAGELRPGRDDLVFAALGSGALAGLIAWDRIGAML